MNFLLKREEEILRWLNKIASTNKITKITTIILARAVIWIMVFASILLSFFATSNFPKYNPVVLFVAIMMLTLSVWVLSTVIKHIVRTRRPFIVLDNFKPLFTFGSLSFPSGHTTFMLMISVVVYIFFGFIVGISFAFFALLSAMARIASGVHWPKDVAGSILLVFFAVSLFSLLF